jgi:ketosteroid isomerase-like protein
LLLSNALAKAGAFVHYLRMKRIFFAIVSTGLSLAACSESFPAAAEKRGPDLFRLARQIECQTLPVEGLRPLLANHVSDQATLAWPAAPLVHGQADARRLIVAQPLLDVTEFGCQTLVALSSADTSLGVTGMLLTLRRQFPDTTMRYGRAMAVWRRTAGKWELELFAPLNIFDIREVSVPDSLTAVSQPRALTPSARSLLESDQALSPVASKEGLAAALTRVLLPEAVAFPSTGELHIGPDAITNPMASVPTDWTWTPLLAGVSNDTTVGWTAGNVDATRKPDGRQASTAAVKYVAFWKRVDGVWRMTMLGTSPR